MRSDAAPAINADWPRLPSRNVVTSSAAPPLAAHLLELGLIVDLDDVRSRFR
jgi:hypothetical protein